MADRYWVGGTGSWNSTAKWSTTSGGASGASVPTASDNAIFDANSATAHYTVTVTDNATCADLTFTPEPADGVTQFAVGNGFVIAGTFSTSGTQGNRRLWLRSSTESLMRDVSIATIGTVTDVDFRDIRITGAGGTLTGTRIGDLKGNVGITFSTPKNCYRIGALATGLTISGRIPLEVRPARTSSRWHKTRRCLTKAPLRYSHDKLCHPLHGDGGYEYEDEFWRHSRLQCKLYRIWQFYLFKRHDVWYRVVSHVFWPQHSSSY
jgi:hypothetical protein